uniref:Uncharacterized protein n=1 Tax=Panagrolaimus sp. JU765 TaxID=591449 RepID=A0AC34Q419_9BILA
MLEKDPNIRRQKYDDYAPFRDSKLFPPIFESFLYHYMGEFRIRAERGSHLIVARYPDDVITKLYVERERFIAELSKDEHNSVILLISLITSNIRACKSISAKMDAITLLKELSKLTPECLSAERIVPYLVRLLSDTFVFVQTESIHVLTEIISNFKIIPIEEARLFVDYIFPKMKEILHDNSTSSIITSTPMVTMAIASNLGTLALTALKFLEEGIKHAIDEGGVIGTSAISPTTPITEDPESAPTSKLPKIETKSLTAIVSEFFTQLITHENNAVRQTIMESENLDKLCLFFERIDGETHNVLMHMITVLNDKSDWRLMSAFFKNCPIVARRNPKTRNSEFFYPLLQQGLQNSEEFVILESLRCIYALCNENRLEKATAFFFIDWINRRFYKESKKHAKKYSLTEQYQLSENIRSASMFKRMAIFIMFGNFICLMFSVLVRILTTIFMKKLLYALLQNAIVFFACGFTFVAFTTVKPWKRKLLLFWKSSKHHHYRKIKISHITVSAVSMTTLRTLKTLDGKKMNFEPKDETRIYFDQLKAHWT